jgi:hypothetical protein
MNAQLEHGLPPAIACSSRMAAAERPGTSRTPVFLLPSIDPQPDTFACLGQAAGRSNQTGSKNQISID